MRDGKKFQNRYRHTQQEVFSSEFCLNGGKINGEFMKLTKDELIRQKNIVNHIKA
jgi:hypothetical protein